VKSFGEASQDRRFDRPRLWRHAVASAAGARLIAQRLRSMDPEEAFLAGLVHDMGIIILDQYFHEGFRRVVDLVFSMGMPLPDAAREIFGRDHAYVGRQLARRWNFPAGVAEAIGCHHEPSRARLNPTLTSIVHLADYLETVAPAEAAPSADGTEAPAQVATAAAPAPGTPLLPVDAPDPFREVGALDEGALAVLGLGPDEVEGLRLAIAAERWRAEAFLSMVP
jgi:putative nucleotidyltransferase with HDIG domain